MGNATTTSKIENGTADHAVLKGDLDFLQEHLNGWFSWINNEDELRDEGALSGINGEQIEPKIMLIEHVIDIQRKSLEEEKMFLEKQYEEVVRKRKVAEALIEKFRSAIIQIDQADYAAERGEQFWKKALLFILTATLLTCHYFLIYWWVRDQIAYPRLVSLGVLLFGAFTVYFFPPLLFDLDDAYREKAKNGRWKLWLETYLPAVLSVTFLASWGRPEVSWMQWASLLLLLLLLFLVSGRLFVRWYFQAHDELLKWKTYRAWRFRQKKQRKFSESQLKENEMAFERLDEDLQNLAERLNDVNKALARLSRLIPTLQYYLQTEYELASQFKANNPNWNA